MVIQAFYQINKVINMCNKHRNDFVHHFSYIIFSHTVKRKTWGAQMRRLPHGTPGSALLHALSKAWVENRERAWVSTLTWGCFRLESERRRINSPLRHSWAWEGFRRRVGNYHSREKLHWRSMEKTLQTRSDVGKKQKLSLGEFCNGCNRSKCHPSNELLPGDTLCLILRKDN